MTQLPKKIGNITLMRLLGADGVSETYAGILDEPAGKAVVARRVLPNVMADVGMASAVRARIGDITSLRHNSLVAVLDSQEHNGELYVVTEAVDGISLADVLAWCRSTGEPLPHNIYLNLATQVCNGLEALHGRPGKASGAQHVLHMGMSPEAIFIDRTGRAIVGHYGLVRSPTAVPSGSTQTTPPGVEYLAPEQTQPGAELSPATDVFALGALLYELLTLDSLFAAESGLQTIHKVRRADVSGKLGIVRDRLPGLDRVLARALSLNPRHRYQRAFVLREDLRGLMAGYSFSNIADHTISHLGGLFDGNGFGRSLSPKSAGTTPEDTAAFLRKGAGGGTLVPEKDDELDSLLGESTEPVDTNKTIDLDETGWIENPNPNSATSTRPPTGERSLINRKATPRPAPPAGPPVPPVPQEPAGSGTVDLDDTGWIPNPNVGDKARSAPPPPRPPPVPQQAAPAPVPPPEPEPVTEPNIPASGSVEVPDDFTDDWEPEPISSGNGVLVAVGAGIVTLVALIVCAGGGGGVFVAGMFASSGGDAPEASVADMVPEPAEPPAAADADAEVDTDDKGKEEVASSSANKSSSPPPRSSGTTSRPSGSNGGSTSSASRPSTTPEPREAAVASGWSSDPDPPARPSTPTYDEPEDDGMAFIAPEAKGGFDDFAPPPVEGTDDASASAGMEFTGDLNAIAERGETGGLTADDRQMLEGWSASDLDYTRAKVILYQDAKVRDDQRARARYMSELMAVPENRYNPTLLVEDAELYIRRKDYDKALEQSNLAERHWARLPSELIFSRKAMIYEIQASSWQGKYYNSGGEDMSSLDNAIHGWEKLKRHAETKNRADLTVKADAQLKRLYDMKRRVGG